MYLQSLAFERFKFCLFLRTFGMEMFMWEGQAPKMVCHCSCLECVTESGAIKKGPGFCAGFGPVRGLKRNLERNLQHVRNQQQIMFADVQKARSCIIAENIVFFVDPSSSAERASKEQSLRFITGIVEPSWRRQSSAPLSTSAHATDRQLLWVSLWRLCACALQCPDVRNVSMVRMRFLQAFGGSLDHARVLYRNMAGAAAIKARPRRFAIVKRVECRILPPPSQRSCTGPKWSAHRFRSLRSALLHVPDLQNAQRVPCAIGSGVSSAHPRQRNNCGSDLICDARGAIGGRRKPSPLDQKLVGASGIGSDCFRRRATGNLFTDVSLRSEVFRVHHHHHHTILGLCARVVRTARACLRGRQSVRETQHCPRHAAKTKAMYREYHMVLFVWTVRTKTHSRTRPC